MLQRFGVAPEQLPAWAALVGDPSDNLQGLAGVGPRTATAWLREHGSLDALFAHAGQLKPARLRRLLEAARERLALNQELATLRSDVPLPDGPQSGPLSAPALARLRGLFEELEFKSLLPRLDALEVAKR